MIETARNRDDKVRRQVAIPPPSEDNSTFSMQLIVQIKDQVGR